MNSKRVKWFSPAASGVIALMWSAAPCLKGNYAKTYDYYGKPTSEGVKEIVWKGGNLGDDEYDEFVLRGYLTPDLKAGEMLYFPVVQECPEGKAERWIEVPAAGQSRR